MNIFIDANIYLDYYRMSTDTIISLQKLEEYLIKKKKKVKLILPTQIQDEFLRNRNEIIRRSLATVKEQSKNAVNFLIARQAKEKNKKSANKIKKQLSKFIKAIENDFTNKNSDINKIINSLFKVATKIPDDDIIFQKAYKRIIKGNPPGKGGSIGDAIAWETLIKYCKKEPLYIISRDGDWKDEINAKQLKIFLLNEWQTQSSRQIKLFKSIGAFLNAVPRTRISKKIIKKEESVASYPTTTSGVWPQSLTMHPDMSSTFGSFKTTAMDSSAPYKPNYGTYPYTISGNSIISSNISGNTFIPAAGDSSFWDGTTTIHFPSFEDLKLYTDTSYLSGFKSTGNDASNPELFNNSDNSKNNGSKKKDKT